MLQRLGAGVVHVPCTRQAPVEVDVARPFARVVLQDAVHALEAQVHREPQELLHPQRRVAEEEDEGAGVVHLLREALVVVEPDAPEVSRHGVLQAIGACVEVVVVGLAQVLVVAVR